MSSVRQQPRSAAQWDRCRRFRTAESVDIHAHCLPGLDDGPETLEQALALCRALVDGGLTRVIATPHQLGRYGRHLRAEDVRHAVADLNRALAAEGIPLAVFPGAEVTLDERIPQLLDTGRLMTLADGGHYILIELPPTVFINIERLIDDLRSRSLTVVVAHPERNGFLATHPDAVLPWVARGVLLQVTAGSLLGDSGTLVRRAAWGWLRSGAASLVSTDAHDTNGRHPCLSATLGQVVSVLGHATARRVCIENPIRVLAGKRIESFCDVQRRRMVR